MSQANFIKYPGFGSIPAKFTLGDGTKEALNTAPYAPYCLYEIWTGNAYQGGDYGIIHKAICIASNIVRNNGKLRSDYYPLRGSAIDATLEPFDDLVCPAGEAPAVLEILTNWAKSIPDMKTKLITWKVCDNKLNFGAMNKFASYVVQVDHKTPAASGGKATFSNAALCSAYYNMSKSAHFVGITSTDYVKLMNLVCKKNIDSVSNDFRDDQKIAIMALNIYLNNGFLRSDYTSDITQQLRLPTRFVEPIYNFYITYGHTVTRDALKSNIDTGKQPIGDNTVAIDHIIPRANGGASDPRNAAVISAESNLKKTNNYIANLVNHYKNEGTNWIG